MDNIRIMGEGTIGKGNFRKISVMGEGELLEDFSAEKLNVYGEAEIKRFFEIKKVRVMGELEARSNGKITEELSVYGEARFDKEIEINLLSIKGEVNIKENLKVKRTNILGGLNVDGNCDADQFNCKGEAVIKGLLNCDKANIELFGFSRINEIGGEIIKVKRGKKIIKGRRGNLKATLIEADEIEIENTECDVIRGNNIIIGKGCCIKRVECTGTLVINKESEVLETIWKKD